MASSSRLGASQVSLVYRGPESRLRASPGEVLAAREEGIELVFEHVPLAIEGEDRAQTVRFAVAAGEASLACDWAILAFGQQADPPEWLAQLGVATDDQGWIRVDPSGRTTNPRVYAGGDNSQGPDLVVTALAAGRRAAEAVLAQPPPRLGLRSARSCLRPGSGETGPLCCGLNARAPTEDIPPWASS